MNFHRGSVVNKIDNIFNLLNKINNAEIELREELGDFRAWCYVAQKESLIPTVKSLCESCQLGSYCAVRKSYKLDVFKCCHYDKKGEIKPVS